MILDTLDCSTEIVKLRDRAPHRRGYLLPVLEDTAVADFPFLQLWSRYSALLLLYIIKASYLNLSIEFSFDLFELFLASVIFYLYDL